MANTKVSQLPSATTITGDDLLLTSQKNGSAYDSKKITGSSFITAIKTLIGKATTSIDGLMSKEDKTKLDGIDSSSSTANMETWKFTLSDGSTVTKKVSAKTA